MDVWSGTEAENILRRTFLSFIGRYFAKLLSGTIVHKTSVLINEANIRYTSFAPVSVYVRFNKSPCECIQTIIAPSSVPIHPYDLRDSRFKGVQ